MEIDCPRCESPCDVEAPDKPWLLYAECGECGLEFSYDDYLSIYYDQAGNEYQKERG